MDDFLILIAFFSQFNQKEENRHGSTYDELPFKSALKIARSISIPSSFTLKIVI